MDRVTTRRSTAIEGLYTVRLKIIESDKGRSSPFESNAKSA